jgi:hypothetical protein
MLQEKLPGILSVYPNLKKFQIFRYLGSSHKTKASHRGPKSLFGKTLFPRTVFGETAL